MSNPRPDLDLLAAQLENIARRGDSYSEDGGFLIDDEDAATCREVIAALAAERARADQAERDVKRYEYRARENRELLDQFAARADQAAAHLAAVEERVTDALLMGTRLDSVKADVMRALQPYAAPTAEQ